jgi:hypothetical protein
VWSPASGWAATGTWWSGRWPGWWAPGALQVRDERRADVLLGFLHLAGAVMCLKVHRPSEA